MDSGETFENRVREAIALAAVTLIANVGRRMMETANQAVSNPEATTELSLNLFTNLIYSLPGIITLAGIVGATLLGGPFGFIGAILETIGGSQLFLNQNAAGLWMIIFGAALVTVGRFIPWTTVFEVLFRSRNRRF
jgi:hypothetical protein